MLTEEKQRQRYVKAGPKYGQPTDRSRRQPTRRQQIEAAGLPYRRPNSLGWVSNVECIIGDHPGKPAAYSIKWGQYKCFACGLTISIDEMCLRAGLVPKAVPKVEAVCAPQRLLPRLDKQILATRRSDKIPVSGSGHAKRLEQIEAKFRVLMAKPKATATFEAKRAALRAQRWRHIEAEVFASVAKEYDCKLGNFPDWTLGKGRPRYLTQALRFASGWIKRNGSRYGLETLDPSISKDPAWHCEHKCTCRAKGRPFNRECKCKVCQTIPPPVYYSYAGYGPESVNRPDVLRRVTGHVCTCKCITKWESDRNEAAPIRELERARRSKPRVDPRPCYACGVMHYARSAYCEDCTKPALSNAWDGRTGWLVYVPSQQDDSQLVRDVPNRPKDEIQPQQAIPHDTLRVWDSTYRGRTGFTADHETGKSKGEGTAELRKIARESGTADMTADMAIRMVEGGSRTRARSIPEPGCSRS